MSARSTDSIPAQCTAYYGCHRAHMDLSLTSEQMLTESAFAPEKELCYTIMQLRDRLMVGRLSLEQLVGVRVPVPQPT